MKSNKEEILPLLSDSLYNVFENLHMASKSPIVRTIMRGHDQIEAEREQLAAKEKADIFGLPLVEVSDTARMISIRDANNSTGEDLGFSYLPKGKSPKYLEDGRWSLRSRQVSSPVKVVRGLLETTDLFHEIQQIKVFGKWCNYEPITGVTSYSNANTHRYYLIDKSLAEGYLHRVHKVPVRRYSDNLYEQFGNSFKASQESETVEFKLVTGNEIREYYPWTKYYSADGERGSLWDSCMRDMNSEVFDLYAECSNCSLLVALKDDKLVGRALVWNTDKGMFMDRVYYYEDYHLNMFVNYAREQGWMYKRKPDPSCRTETMVKKGETYENQGYVEMTITGCSTQYEYFPYLDTFKYLALDGTLSNSGSTNWYYELEDPDGGYSQCIDDDDNDNYREEDEEEDSEEIDACLTCAISGAIISHDESVWVTDTGWTSRDLTMTDFEGSAILLATAVHLSNGQYASPSNLGLVTLYSGERSHIQFATRVGEMWYPHELVYYSEEKERWELVEYA